MGQAWNEDRINLLKRLWDEENLPASVIGAQLGLTRSAVIGKVHRLGLSSRKRPTPPPGSREQWGSARNAQRRARNARAKMAPKVEGAPAPVCAPQKPVPMPPVEGGISILDLEPHHCRAIIGMGPEGHARYCGDTKEVALRISGASPYCPGHGALYYTPRIPR